MSSEARLTAFRFVVPDEAGVIVKARDFGLEPLDPLETVTTALPAVDSEESGIVACSAEALMKFVTSDEPFHSTEAPGWKLLPVTLSATDEDPAAATWGLIVVNLGSGCTLVPVVVSGAANPETKLPSSKLT